MGADKAYDTQDFVATAHELNVTVHAQKNNKGRRSCLDRRTTRHAGYARSLSRRWLVEKTFGWLKGTGPLRQVKLRGVAEAIDVSVFEGPTDGEQRIYITHLKNSWTIDSTRTLLSSPKFSWEHVGDLLEWPALPHTEVNEGPEILTHGGHLSLVYSDSACWTDYYELGVVEAMPGTELLKPGVLVQVESSLFLPEPLPLRLWTWT